MTAQTWPMVKLGDVANINPPAPQHLPHDTIVSFLPMKNVSEDGSLVLDECPYNGTKKGYTSLKKQDIIVAKITPCFENKKIAIAHIPNKYGFGSTEFHVIRCSEKLNNRFAFYFLRQDRINKLGQEYMTGSAGQKRIPQTFLKDLLIPLPPLSEQKRIAAILDKAYDLCQLRRHALKKLDVLGEAIFHDMFRYIEKDNANIRITKLENIIEILDNMRRPITKKDRNPGIFPYYGATGVLDYIDKYIFNEPLVLLGEDGAKWGKSEKSAYPILGKTWVNNHAHVLKPNRKKITDIFLIFFLNKTDLTPFVSGTTVPKLNQKNTKQIPIPLPPLAEQERFAARIAKIEALQEHHRQALAKQEMLFQSLQQRAFRGEL
ncbi:restriction endonuclease subunit S [Bombella favorum]|uniref:Type I restriction modification DNA specificity domain-containing protein n=1 Tax=Bombella favorum TaxID=2039164 RepID=A0ABR5ZNS2_9PROT|nr:restriction endonuclease subunit S [Bombella favorum]MBA5725920.1 hypothetical protein [Bombella favorum]